MAFLVYRGNPRCGGQGVYTRHLTRELAYLGHEVTVFAGQPYPELDEPVSFVPVPSLDLYREPDPFRIPRLSELTSTIDALELAIMCSGGFPEPRTFSLRARRLLAARRGDFDLVHDNQSLGSGLIGMMRDGWPLVATIHHPITVDRELDLAHADGRGRRLALRRWYGFVRMQARVARRVARIVTVSETSGADIAAKLGVASERLSVVPVGVDESVFRPRPERARVRGRLMTTASADVPMKGLVPLLEALARVRRQRDEAHLVVVGRLKENSRVERALQRLRLEGDVQFVSDVTDDEVAELYASAEVAVVPSLYEGFSLPAIEAMSCGVPLVATTGGALPEVVGRHGETALLVEPNDPVSLANAICSLLEDSRLRSRLARAARRRTLERFTWPIAARETAEEYYRLLDERARGGGRRSEAGEQAGAPPAVPVGAG